jgi:uncharacterized protein YqiB (DUF1249 family)
VTAHRASEVVLDSQAAALVRLVVGLEVAALAEEIHSEVLAVTTSYEIPNHDKTGLHEHLTVEEFWASWLHRWDQNLRRWFLHWQWH